MDLASSDQRPRVDSDTLSEAKATRFGGLGAGSFHRVANTPRESIVSAPQHCDMLERHHLLVDDRAGPLGGRGRNGHTGSEPQLGAG